MAEDPRTIEQNDKMWSMLTDISKQVDWPVNGVMRKMSKEDWKDVFTAHVMKEQRIAAGLEGGFVMLGCRTSNKGKRWLSELIEIIGFFGDSKQVKWTPSKKAEQALNAWKKVPEASR